MNDQLIVVVEQASDPWSIVVQVLASVVAVAIAVLGVLRDNWLRRREQERQRRESAERARARARGLVITAEGNIRGGGGRSSSEVTYTVLNQTGAAVLDVAVVPENASDGEDGTWLCEFPTGASYPAIAAGTKEIFRWVRSEPNGPPTASPQFTPFTATWRDADWRPFIRTVDGDVAERTEDPQPKS